jgi:hypothetical protein
MSFLSNIIPNETWAHNSDSSPSFLLLFATRQHTVLTTQNRGDAYAYKIWGPQSFEGPVRSPISHAPIDGRDLFECHLQTDCSEVRTINRVGDSTIPLFPDIPPRVDDNSDI